MGGSGALCTPLCPQSPMGRIRLLSSALAGFRVASCQELQDNREQLEKQSLRLLLWKPVVASWSLLFDVAMAH